ncbi:hypothetical protein TNCV_2192121 [Trichonephila clavipes]|nr:hypothetical protein TNCV_2192121 [Trichonephila clavipes]
MGFHEFSTGTPAREPPSFSARFSLKFLKVHRFQFSLAAPAREDCLVLLDATTGQPDCTLSAAVHPPFFSFSSRPEENLKYTKKDGADKDYTTNTQRFKIS